MADDVSEPMLPIELPEHQAPAGFQVDADDAPCRFCSTLVPHDAWAGLCDECGDSAEWDN